MSKHHKGIVQTVNEQITKEMLKEQDGKKVPLTLYPGGPVIGEATLTYDEGGLALTADISIDDPKMAEFFKSDPPSISKKES